LLKAAWGRGPGLWRTEEACETRPRRLIAPGAGAGHRPTRSPSGRTCDLLRTSFEDSCLRSSTIILTSHYHSVVPNQFRTRRRCRPTLRCAVVGREGPVGVGAAARGRAGKVVAGLEAARRAGGAPAAAGLRRAVLAGAAVAGAVSAAAARPARERAAAAAALGGARDALGLAAAGRGAESAAELGRAAGAGRE